MFHSVLQNYGIFGYPVLFLIMIAQVIIPPIPAEAIVIGASMLYGIWPVTFVAGFGLWIGSIIVFHFGKTIRNLFPRFWEKDKVNLVVNALRKHEDFLLWLRILPYNPADIISYAAGIIHVEKRKFYAISFAVSFTRVFTLAWMGSVIEDWQTLSIVLAILVSSAVLGYAAVYWWKNY